MPPHTRARVCAESLAPLSEPDRRVRRSYRHTRRAMTTTIAAKMNQAIASSLCPLDGYGRPVGALQPPATPGEGAGAPVTRERLGWPDDRGPDRDVDPGQPQ